MMKAKLIVPVTALAAVALLAVAPQWASAQRRGGFGGFRGGFGTVSQVQLLQAEQVQTELELSDQQKTQVEEINEQLRTERRELFQQGGGQGDFQERAAKLAELTREANTKAKEALNEQQAKRLQEIWLQVAGPAALNASEIVAALEITDDQKQQLESVRSANQEARRELFQGQGQDRQQLRARMAELREQENEQLLAVLTEQQRAKFKELQGEPIELDLSQAFGRFGGGRGPGRRGQ